MTRLTDAHYTYTPANADWLTFVWTAGPYIDVIANNTQETVDCINVWDYEHGKPRIPVTLDDFREECDQWTIDRYAYEDLSDR